MFIIVNRLFFVKRIVKEFYVFFTTKRRFPSVIVVETVSVFFTTLA
jgi:hypothetical protein